MTDPATTAPADTQKLRFYQKGTFTVGNRLVSDAERSVQASIDRSNALTCGHRACQGCGRMSWAATSGLIPVGAQHGRGRLIRPKRASSANMIRKRRPRLAEARLAFLTAFG